MIFGAGADNANNLPVLPEAEGGYPVRFGKGSWQEAAGLNWGDDNKVRFIYDVTDTTSGFVYVGNKLVSSKIINVQKVSNDSTVTLEVTYLNTDTSTLETLSFLPVVESDSNAINVEKAVVNNDQVYKVSLKLDNPTQDGFVNLAVTENGLAAADFTLNKLTDVSSAFAAQYALKVRRAGDSEYVQVGDTINIMKDYFIKAAYVVTYDRNSDGTPYTGSVVDIDPTALDVYGILPLNASVYADKTATVDDNLVYLEKAVVGNGLKVKHTYLHLVVNTTTDDESTDTSVNYDTNDVFLDFTEIIESDAFAGKFAELDAKIEDVSNRVETVENTYIKSVTTETLSGDKSQFDAVSFNYGEDSSVRVEIPNSTYFDAVDTNFDNLKNVLTWQGLA